MDGTWRWFFQRISGIALLAFLFVHFWVIHYYPGGEITYERVAQRLVQPEWKFFNLTFLVLALSHGLNGLWTISEDYIGGESLRMTLFGIVIMAGLFLLVTGTLIIVSFQA